VDDLRETKKKHSIVCVLAEFDPGTSECKTCPTCLVVSPFKGITEGCLRTECWWKYMDLTKSKKSEPGESWIMRSLIICTPRQILLGWNVVVLNTVTWSRDLLVSFWRFLVWISARILTSAEWVDTHNFSNMLNYARLFPVQFIIASRIRVALSVLHNVGSLNIVNNQAQKRREPIYRWARMIFRVLEIYCETIR
jgi:hypothetical protein